MNNKGETPKDSFYIVWIPVEGDLAKFFGYAGPWGHLPFFVEPLLKCSKPDENSVYMWQLLKRILYCWDTEPKGGQALPERDQLKILRQLLPINSYDSLEDAVWGVARHMEDFVNDKTSARVKENGKKILAITKKKQP